MIEWNCISNEINAIATPSYSRAFKLFPLLSKVKRKTFPFLYYFFLFLCIPSVKKGGVYYPVGRSADQVRSISRELLIGLLSSNLEWLSIESR